VRDGNYARNVARRTWRRGILHLTVDGEGLVALWDCAVRGPAYLKLALTAYQVRRIRATMARGGVTP
jgi:hypothetical protein